MANPSLHGLFRITLASCTPRQLPLSTLAPGPAQTGREVEKSSSDGPYKQRDAKQLKIPAGLAPTGAIGVGSKLVGFAPWTEKAHTRPPDGNHGVWLLPMRMEATTTPWLSIGAARRASPPIGHEAPVSGIGEKTVGLTFEGKIWSILACCNSPK